MNLIMDYVGILPDSWYLTVTSILGTLVTEIVSFL